MKYTGEKPKMEEQIDVINVYVTMITVLTKQNIYDILIKRTTKYRFFFLNFPAKFQNNFICQN